MNVPLAGHQNKLSHQDSHPCSSLPMQPRLKGKIRCLVKCAVNGRVDIMLCMAAVGSECNKATDISSHIRDNRVEEEIGQSQQWSCPSSSCFDHQGRHQKLSRVGLACFVSPD